MCATLLLIAFTVIGCGNSSAKGASDHGSLAGVSELAHHFSAGLWRFYREVGRQPGVANVIDHAEQTVIARCMRRGGFAYHPVPPEPVGGVLLDGLSNAPSGDPPPKASMLDVERTRGFGIYDRVKAGEPKGAMENSHYVASLGPKMQRRYFLALDGNPHSTFRVKFPDGSIDRGPAGGCVGASSTIVYGSVSRDDFRLNAVVDVQHLVEHDVSAQSAMKAATRRWSRCFERKTGRRFASQGQLIGWLTQQYGARSRATAHRTEIRYSMLSTICMYRTGAAARYAATTWDVLSHMPAAWYRTLVEVRKSDAQALRTAHAILRHSGGVAR